MGVSRFSPEQRGRAVRLVAEGRAGYPSEWAGFSKQAFYAWKADPVSQRDWDDAHLINAALDIHSDDPESGYRCIADELAGQGVVAGRNRVNRLCTLQRVLSVHSRRRGLNRKPGPPVHDDLVERQSTATPPTRRPADPPTRRPAEPAVADR